MRIPREMLSLLALVSAILLAVAVEAGSLVWLGLTLFTAGCLPVALAFTRSAGIVTLHVGSFCAQTGLIVVVIALVP